MITGSSKWLYFIIEKKRWWKLWTKPTFVNNNSNSILYLNQIWWSFSATVMNLPRGAPSCLPSHQSEQPAQVSSARRTSRGSTARFPSSRWVGRLEEEVSHTPGDSLTAALPKTTKVIGRWNDRPHSYTHSPRAKKQTRCWVKENIRGMFHFVLFACEKVCEDIFMLSITEYVLCTEISWRNVDVGVPSFSIKTHLLSKTWSEMKAVKRLKIVGIQPPWWIIEE